MGGVRIRRAGSRRCLYDLAVSSGGHDVPGGAAIRRPDVIDEVFEGEAVVVNLATGMYFALNADATRIWRAIADARPWPELADAVAAETGADPADVLAVVTAFAGELADHGLVALGDEATPVAPPPADVPFTPALQVFSDMEDLLLLDPIHDIDVDGTGWPQAPAPTGP